MNRGNFSFPSRLEWLFSIKTFIASMAALYIALKLQLPRPYWAMATVYIVSNPFAGSSRSKAVYRAVGTFVGAAATVVLLPPFVEEPLLFSAIIALWCGTLLFASMHDRSARSYAFVLAGYTMPLVAMSAVNAPYDVFDIAVARVEEITVGIICASVLGSLILPVKLSSSVAERTAGWFNDAATLGRHCLAIEPDTCELAATRQRLVTMSNSLEFLVSQLGYDHLPQPIIKQAQRLLQRMQLLVVIAAAVADSLAFVKTARERRPAGLASAVKLVSERFDDATATRLSLAQVHQQLIVLRHSCTAATTADSATLDATFRRLRQLADVWEDCLTLEQSLRTHNPVWRGSLRHWRVGRHKPYRDIGALMFSAATAVVGIFVGCSLWIYSGWTDGALGATLASVSCCLFATLDDPLSAIRQYFIAVCASIILSGFYLVVVVPHVQDFAMLVLIFCVPFILVGAIIPRPRYAVATLLTAVNTATFLGIEGIYDVDFASFLNLNLAGPVGLLFALLWTQSTKPIGTDWLVSRHLRRSWSDIVNASSLQPISDQRNLAAFALDRLMQTLQRQPPTYASGRQPSADSLRDARILFSVLDLRRVVRRIPADRRKKIESALCSVASYFGDCIRNSRRVSVPSNLLQAIETALEAGGTHDVPRARIEANIYLADLRTALFHAAGDPS